MAEEEKPAAEEKKGKGLIFVIVGVVVAVLLLVGVVVFMFMGSDDEEHGGGGGHGGGSSAPAVANLTPEQQALLQNEAYKNPAAVLPIEKDFIVNLKSPNPESLSGGFVKFKVTFILSDKNVVKEIGNEERLDVIRSIITDVASGFMASELQSVQGRSKLGAGIANGVNSILVDGKVAAVVFPDFIIQP